MSGDSKNSEISLERVLCLLDRWRHLPAYQLEPRADVFFALLLPAVLGIRDLHLIPQFPIKKSLLPEPRRDDTYQSINVDYLAVSEDLARSFLIELKTDMMSIKEEQIEDLKFASCKGMAEIVCGLIEIAKGDRNRITRGKYSQLLELLEERGLIQQRHDDKVRVNDRVRQSKLDVVYVIPKCLNQVIEDMPRSAEKWERIRGSLEGVCLIHFDDFIRHAEKQGGIAGSRFAESLKRWKSQAGLCRPE